MPYLHSCAKVVSAFLLSVFRSLQRRRDFVNSCFFFPLHICIGRAFGDPYVTNSQVRRSQIHANAQPWRSSYTFLSWGAECARRGDGSDFSHLRAAGEGAGSRCNPSAKVLKRSVGRQEMANCISFVSFIKENTKCVEVSLLYFQLQATRHARSSMWSPQAGDYCETHASDGIQFTSYPG